MVYFVHSFAPEIGQRNRRTCDYGGRSPLLQRTARCGAPVPPEKSARSGSPCWRTSWRRLTRCAPDGAAMMELLPAIDLIDGRAVRLLRGDFDERSDYGDPLRLAQEFLDGGANWLHVVDLDGAKSGSADNDRSCSPWRPSVRPSRRAGGYARRPTSRSSSTRGSTGWCSGPRRSRTRVAGAMGRRFGSRCDRPRLPARHRRPAGARHQGLAGRLGPLGRGVVRRARRRALRAWSSRPSIETARSGAPTSRDSRAARPLAVARDCLRRRRLGRGSLRTGADGGLDRAPAGRGHRRQGLVDGRVSMEEAVAACALSA